jgi:ubiquinone/menaquinone biosynthesis C-methylase UbiE
MKSLPWDYTSLAGSYAGRPPYASEVLDELVSIAGVGEGDRVADIGAGTGHMTVALLERELVVDAVEPNDAMRAIGRERLQYAPVTWHEARAEDTGLLGNMYRLVSFGSSFNVVDTDAALAEVARLLTRPGWVTMLWNHRDIENDPLQSAIEALIASHVKDYDYGARRRDPSDAVRASGRFGEPRFLSASVDHEVEAEDWIEAWYSHATLARQAGDQMERIVDAIQALVDEAQTGGRIVVPYTTRCWVAPVREP